MSCNLIVDVDVDAALRDDVILAVQSSVPLPGIEA
jgi:hypothetical protein